MVRSNAPTVEAYLVELPAEKRAVAARVRAFVRRCLPEGYVEGMRSGKISYEVPLKRYAEARNGQPLVFVALAVQKNYYSLYLNSLRSNALHEEWLRAEYEAAGKPLDLGKTCLRFRSLEDLLLEPIAFIISSTPVDVFIAQYRARRPQ